MFELIAHLIIKLKIGLVLGLSTKQAILAKVLPRAELKRVDLQPNVRERPRATNDHGLKIQVFR